MAVDATPSVLPSFLSAIAACMIKGIERVNPVLKFDLQGVDVRLSAVREDAPPLIVRVDYERIVETDGWKFGDKSWD